MRFYLGRDSGKCGRHFSIIGLCRNRLRPIERKIKMAVAGVCFTNAAPWGFVVR